VSKDFEFFNVNDFENTYDNDGVLYCRKANDKLNREGLHFYHYDGEGWHESMYKDEEIYNKCEVVEEALLICPREIEKELECDHIYSGNIGFADFSIYPEMIPNKSKYKFCPMCGEDITSLRKDLK